MKKDKKEKAEELEKKIEELTNDLIRTRADFENYRKRVESEKEQAKVVAKSAIISKLLPIIDDIELAISYAPENLKDNPWVKGVNKLSLKLETSLSNLGVKTIDAKSNTTFDPKLHDAILMDDSSEGEEEIILEELRKGYLYNDAVTSINDIKNKLQLEFQVDSLLEQKVIEDIENTIHYFKEHHVLKEINE